MTRQLLTLGRLVNAVRIDSLGGSNGHEAGDEEGNEGVGVHV